MEDYLELGQIVNTFGIKGMVKVVPFTDDVEQFKKLSTIYIKNKTDKKEYEIQEAKFHKNMVLLKLKGIETPEEATLLRNSYVLIDRSWAEPLEDGTYYIVDMLGSSVYTDEGIALGKLEDIFNTGSNDIYVVKDELGKQILLPAIADVVKDIDVSNKKIIVHIIKGLM
jgi:16S rRNA processing protein RimM